MENKLWCGECGKSYWPRQAWTHEEVEGVFKCTGKPRGQNKPEEFEVLAAPISEPERKVSPKKQRWSREAYNAYQREYMRKRRAK